MSRVVALELEDIRFPTSRTLDGSDAMNPDPDYSAAYLRVTTDLSSGLSGHAFAFTIGRGNDVQVAAISAVGQSLIGRDVDELLANMGATARELAADSQFRWLGPEKGVIHMALGAVVNALWDLKAKMADKPLWQLLASMTPTEIVELVDFTYLSNVLTPSDALGILEAATVGREERETALVRRGYPAYTTTPGWLGYSDEKLSRLCRQARDEGFGQIKLKVGASLEDDKRRLSIAREVCGPGFPIAVDANQRWEVDEAIDWIRQLEPYDIAWVEEPTGPDDILGLADIASQVFPVRIATGEHVHNRVMFKQLLQAKALSVLQIDAARVGGVNENVAILLLAAKFGIPVCPHAGGVGLCEAVQHLSMFDFLAVSGRSEGRWIEYVDHLHEHMAIPADVRGGRYFPPTQPGGGMEILQDSREKFGRAFHV